MTHLRTVIGLLHRADWTRLSLSADVHFEGAGPITLRGLSSTAPPGAEGPRGGHHSGNPMIRYRSCRA